MLKNIFRKLAQDDRGLSTMEYAVLFVIIVVGSLALWQNLGKDLGAQIKGGSATFANELGQHSGVTTSEGGGAPANTGGTD